jgi:16S rRNA (cytosine967-C5)-methyltransferase
VHYFAHLIIAKKLLSAYRAEVPLNIYLKGYFKQNKKHGSKDRKLISTLCYSFFRLGFAANDLPAEERILFAYFLCHSSHSEFLASLKPEWNAMIDKLLNEKIAIHQFRTKNIFPFKDELSNEVDFDKFNISFLKQPKLFIRIRPHCEKQVFRKLREAKIYYEALSQYCIALPNSSKINNTIELDKEAVVQDYNSQRIGKFIKLVTNESQPDLSVWDCCAASGGKSILAYDINSSVQLTVSDKRESIIKNLLQRFSKAGIKNYTSHIWDLSTDSPQRSIGKFDLIIADVPCTGSGTWSRTPEQLYYFNKSKIEEYRNLQKKIIENAVGYLKPGGWLLYITCSVFKKENEDLVGFVKDKLKMQLIKIELLRGYEIEADTMFAALARNV